MATLPKNLQNMRKHLTKAERQSREAAEVRLERETRVSIHAPKWLSVEARKVFEYTKRRMKPLKLLDNVDADLLAMYADAVVNYKDAVDARDKQAWSRLALSYAEKMGISPTGRARLAKKTAEQRQVDEFEELLDEFEDFVNGDVR
jgi:phage terminase small subunit